MAKKVADQHGEQTQAQLQTAIDEALAAKRALSQVRLQTEVDQATAEERRLAQTRLDAVNQAIAVARDESQAEIRDAVAKERELDQTQLDKATVAEHELARDQSDNIVVAASSATKRLASIETLINLKSTDLNKTIALIKFLCSNADAHSSADSPAANQILGVIDLCNMANANIESALSSDSDVEHEESGTSDIVSTSSPYAGTEKQETETPRRSAWKMW
ncbi:hypothetical protein CC86DRAFT_410185 [Ophiobolus disseminans]|uniref:Uncharacterized protein n=1 Tax=Ophiobolus disseminans TaxID=1469910 RepID=A0A6A6ZQK2_9PLEO|nr:hypothetical protein CC86DRAFT_410185 [Ophiobolus disseminans]